ncbi:MAG TPA: hypothetical protein VGI40_24885 [Pirellulaceae bacterium]|jgi:hypothetical protein
MKASLNGLGGIKGIALAHGEKLGMAIVACLALFLIYKALQLPSLDSSHQPNELDGLVSKAKAAVEAADFASAPADQVRYYKASAKVAETTIPEKAYSVAIDWDPAVVPPVVLRKDPVLLNAQKLEANGGSGLLAFTNDDIRKQRALEEQQEAERKAKADQKELDRQQKEGEQGKGQRSGGAAKNDRTGRGGEMIDPEHPNRRAVSGMARPAGIPIAGDEEIRTAYWATVLAKVPIKEQFKLYHDAFEKARGYAPESDSPHYLGFKVQRAEIVPGQDKLNWQPVSVYNGKGQLIGSAVSSLTLNGRTGEEGKKSIPGVADDWAARSEEVVDPRYLDDDGVLAFPLPPMVGRGWGAEVTHSDIPLASQATDTEAETPQPEEKKPDAAAAPAVDEFAPGDPNNTSATSRGGPPSIGRGGGRSRGGYGGGGGRGGYGQRGMAISERGGRGEYTGAAGRGGPRGAAADLAPQVPNWLLRFFDFSVEPGKKYKYRVQLVLQDPNQNAPSDSLDSSVINRLKSEKAAKHGHYRTPEDWSEPSPIVSIPLAGNVHVAAAKPASDRLNDEPSATLLVDSFGSDDKGKATEAAKEDEFKRGSVANMTKDVEILDNQGQQAFIDLAKNFQFRTGITVIDIDGGEQLAKDLKKPARVLLMDPAGQLFVQNEVDDQDAVQLHRDIFSDADKKGTRTGGRGEPAPPGREGPRSPGGFQQGFGR